jgi:replication factor A1
MSKTEIYIKKIIEETGLSKKDIQERLEEKKEELKGLITDKGALFVIAKELGVEIKDQSSGIVEDIELNVSDIKPGMKNIVLVGRVKEINQIHTFNRKDGSEGKVGSFLLHDKTGDIRVTLWDKETELLNSREFDVDELVKIVNGYSKKGKFSGTEIHIGKLGKVIVSPTDVDYKKYPKISQKTKQIKDVSLSLNSVNIQGKVIRKRPVNYFDRKDGSKGRVSSINLADSTGSIRITFWDDNTEKIESIESGNVIKITNLNPRQSNLDSTQIELFARNSTKIEKIDEDIEISTPFVENIAELQDKSDIVSFKGVVSSVDNLKEVNLKSGEKVSLLSFVVSDETDGIRVTLWRDLAEKYVKKLEGGKGVFLKNVLIRYSNFSKRKEVTFTKSSELEFIDLNISEVKEIEETKPGERSTNFTRDYTKLKAIDSPGFYEIKGVIVKEIKNITIYDSCSECFKKIDNCACESPGEIEKRMIINLILDDGTDTIRTTFIGERAEELLEEDTDVVAKIVDTPDYNTFLEKISQNLLGKDFVIRGKAKFSDFSKRYEIIAYDFKELDVEKELKYAMQEI